MQKSLVFVLLSLPVSAALAEEKPKSEIRAVEKQLLAAMGGNMGEDFAELRRAIDALPPDARRALGVAIRPGEFSWRFHGVHPADTLDPRMLEYVVSSEIKNYESLLVVEGEELERLHRFGRAFSALRGRSPDVEVAVQLAWSEEGRLRSLTLWDIFASAEIEKVEHFLQLLDATPSGLGADNLEADAAVLPTKNVPAEVTIMVRLPPPDKEPLPEE